MTVVPQFFEDRGDAGRQLAERVASLPDVIDPIVLALPRGGVPVAYEVARALGAELDVLVVRKLGVPGQPEFAMGAIVGGQTPVLDRTLVRQLGLSTAQVDEVIRQERAELARRERHYRGENAPPPRLAGRTVIVVDDGLATGSTMQAALSALQGQGVQRLIVAVPVAPPGVARRFDGLADAFVCLLNPPGFRAVGAYYVDFGQTTDAQVARLLAAARERLAQDQMP